MSSETKHTKELNEFATVYDTIRVSRDNPYIHRSHAEVIAFEMWRHQQQRIRELEARLAELHTKHEMLLNQLKQPDVVYAAIMRGDIAKPLIFEDARPIKEELERERIRLAACGVVALSNTPESAAKAREMLPEYQSASCDDVARAVDKQMALEQQNRELREALLDVQIHVMAGHSAFQIDDIINKALTGGG